MAEVRNSQPTVEVFEDTSKDPTVNGIHHDSPAVGVYSRPATASKSPRSALMTMFYILAILVLVYLIYQWLT